MAKTNNERLKHIIYGRKSKFTGKGESVENQVDLCKNDIILHNPNVTDDDILVFMDEGFTGANLNRPAFQEMMNYIKKHGAIDLRCYRLDRISRNVGDFCNLIKELQNYDVPFISIKEKFDTSTSMGNAMMMISSVFAQLERDTIAERIRDNMMELAKTGRWLGGTTPLGYKSEEINKINYDGKKKKLFKLIEVPLEKSEVVLLKNKYKEIKSQTGLETYTIKNNLKTRLGKRFTRWSIVNILSNPVYSAADKDSFDYFTKKGAIVVGERKDYNGKYGLMVYNKTNQLKKKGAESNPITEWIVAIGKHNPFWSGKEFVEVQELLELGAKKRFRKPTVNNALLSGIIRCEYCGNFMRPKLYKENKDGTRNFAYMCELKDKSRKTRCQCKNINGIEVDKKVMEVLKEITAKNSSYLKKIQCLANGTGEHLTKEENEYYALNAEIKKNEKEIELLIDRLKIVPVDIVPEIAKEIQKLKAANNQITERIKELNVDTLSLIKNQDDAKLVMEVIENNIIDFSSLDLVQKRSLVKLFISSVYSDGKNIRVKLTGSKENSKTIELPSRSGGDGNE